MPRPLRRWLLIFILIPGLYILSVLWRVSLAEHQLYGRSHLIPLSLHPPRYKRGIARAYNAPVRKAFVYDRQGRKIVVWRQKVNGFQHIYGSSLVAYELGEPISDWLFCGNEFSEAFWDALIHKKGIEPSDLRDRRKDLYHNALGRIIGREARQQGLFNHAVDQAMRERIANQIEHGGYIPHYNDTAVDALPTEADFHCPGLPPVWSLYSRS